MMDIPQGKLLSSELAQLSTETVATLRARLSNSTKTAYRSDIARFVDFCDCDIPASPADTANYMTRHKLTHKLATIRRWRVSIGRYHRENNWPDPCDSHLMRETMKGLEREMGSAQRRVSALFMSDLVRILAPLTLSPRDLRDRALILLGFGGALRRSEVAALMRESISMHGHAVIVTLPRSKTNQVGALEQVSVAGSPNPLLCPITALENWLRVNPREALFPGIDKYGQISYAAMCDRTVSRVIKKRCADVGLNPDRYSGHSMRAGYATTAALKNVPPWQIKRHTRHKKYDQLDKYIRTAELLKPIVVLTE